MLYDDEYNNQKIISPGKMLLGAAYTQKLINANMAQYSKFVLPLSDITQPVTFGLQTNLYSIDNEPLWPVGNTNRKI